MTDGLRILVTNNTLHDRAGSELFVRDLALGLARRGHVPTCYSTALGEVAAELRAHGIAVVDDLSSLAEPPDLVHGQHHIETMSAVLRWPRVPALFVCHGAVPWQEEPPVFPSILRYVAVDDACRARVKATPGTCDDRIRTIYNAVDLVRFRPRPPLPARPRTALVLSHAASDATFLGPIRAACATRGIERVDVAGRASARPTAEPERLLPAYDVVFAKARAALEAMAVGCAVVVADAAGFGGLVTPDALPRMRPLNFGLRTMEATPLTEARVGAALDAYDVDACAEVSRWIREHAGLERALDEYAAVYAEVLADRTALAAVTPERCAAAASAYTRRLGDLLKQTVIRHEAAVNEATRISRELHSVLTSTWGTSRGAAD